MPRLMTTSERWGGFSDELPQFPKEPTPSSRTWVILLLVLAAILLASALS